MFERDSRSVRVRASRRAFLAAGGSLLAVGATGCFGSFGATNALYDWNEEVSQNKWLRALVFFVLIVVPVYEIFILADAIVLNTLEFWTGTHPVGGSATRKLENGYALRTSDTDDPSLIRHEIFDEDGALVRSMYVRRRGENEMQLLDGQGLVLGSARRLDNGDMEIRDAAGELQRTVPAERVIEVAARVERGHAPTRLVADYLPAASSDAQLASRVGRTRL